jgi:hypothetical protein
MTHRFLSVIDIDTSVARKSFFDPAKLSLLPFLLGLAELKHSLRAPEGDNGSCCFFGRSGFFLLVGRPVSSLSHSNDTNFRFPFFFRFFFIRKRRKRAWFFFRTRSVRALTSGFFYPIRPSIPAFLFFVFLLLRKSLTDRDSESLMQTAPNCSRRLSTINGRREWKSFVAHDRCRIQSIYWKRWTSGFVMREPERRRESFFVFSSFFLRNGANILEQKGVSWLNRFLVFVPYVYSDASKAQARKRKVIVRCTRETGTWRQKEKWLICSH